MLIRLSLHSSLSVFLHLSWQIHHPPPPFFAFFPLALLKSLCYKCQLRHEPQITFLDECWHLPLTLQLMQTEWRYLPLFSLSLSLSTLYLFLYRSYFFFFFLFYFSLSLQTDIHASLHMGFNLPLSPKIFLAQAWDKGIITSKGS